MKKNNHASWLKPHSLLSVVISLLKNAVITLHLKSICLVMAAITATSLVYADSADFTFLYGPGITSMLYLQTFHDKSSHLSGVTLYPYASHLTVNVTGNFQASDAATDDFNKNYNSNHSMGIGTANPTITKTDIYITGTLLINGNIVATDFSLAHEHKSKDWWIATNVGHRENGTQYTVKDEQGNYYCLNQNNTNFQVVVTSGQCSGTNPYFPALKFSDNRAFTFLYTIGISSVEYVNSYNANPLITGKVSPSATGSQLTINVNGDFTQGLDWEANMFNNKYSNQNKLGLKLTNSEAAATDIYISGTLKINGYLIATDFALAHENKTYNWWVATTAGTRKDDNIPSQFELVDITGNLHYCLQQNGTNFQVWVAPGYCFPNDWWND